MVAYAIKHTNKAKADAVREDRKVTKAKLENIKSRRDWLNDAQKSFNKFIRLRDQHLACISCGRFHSGQYHAGHYRTIGSSPELRFEEHNCHRQCAPCNNHLSGNIVNYRPRLLEKIGAEALASLEGPHPPLNLSIEDIKAIKSKYAALCKQLEKEQS